MEKVDRILRRLVPSVARLTYNTWSRNLLDFMAAIPNVFFPEFKKLPPNHLRVRVGVGNRIFFNQVQHLTTGVNFWLHAFGKKLCSLDSQIVDLGCGCGRIAGILRDYSMGEAGGFIGHYTGVDIDPEAVNWCRNNFPADRFSFILSENKSSIYGAANNPHKLPESKYLIPIIADTHDFVFSLSLFTHLLESDMINYLQESYRVLRPGGIINMSFFNYDRMLNDGLLGGRFTFEHQIANAYIENRKYPEAAVAYKGEFLIEKARKIGFKNITIFKWHEQDILQGRK